MLSIISRVVEMSYLQDSIIWALTEQVQPGDETLVPTRRKAFRDIQKPTTEGYLANNSRSKKRKEKDSSGPARAEASRVMAYKLDRTSDIE